jgi:hypothetical protein
MIGVPPNVPAAHNDTYAVQKDLNGAAGGSWTRRSKPKCSITSRRTAASRERGAPFHRARRDFAKL